LGFTRCNSLLILTNLIGGWLVYGMIGWTIYAAMMMALAVRSMKSITLVEAMSWDWSHLWKRTIPGSRRKESHTKP